MAIKRKWDESIERSEELGISHTWYTGLTMTTTDFMILPDSSGEEEPVEMMDIVSSQIYLTSGEMPTQRIQTSPWSDIRTLRDEKESIKGELSELSSPYVLIGRNRDLRDSDNSISTEKRILLHSIKQNHNMTSLIANVNKEDNIMIDSKSKCGLNKMTKKSDNKSLPTSISSNKVKTRVGLSKKLNIPSLHAYLKR